MIIFKDIETKLDKVISMAFEIKINSNIKQGEEHDLADIDIDALSYTKEEEELCNYLKGLNDEEVHAIISIMYIGRDGYEGITGNTDDILNECMELLDIDKKEHEIYQMIDKVVLYDYLAKGKYLLLNK